jgi:hypothetical protein
MPDLNIIWFGLVGVLLTGYAILDGFDLGVGALWLPVFLLNDDPLEPVLVITGLKILALVGSPRFGAGKGCGEGDFR